MRAPYSDTAVSGFDDRAVSVPAADDPQEEEEEEDDAVGEQDHLDGHLGDHLAVGDGVPRLDGGVRRRPMRMVGVVCGSTGSFPA